MTTYWTITNAGTEKSLTDWGIDDVDVTFISQAEDEAVLSCAGRRMDAAYLFAYKSTVVIRKGRVRASDGSYSGGSYYFTGICAHPHVGAKGGREFQACSIVGPWWFLNERGFEQEYIRIASITGGVPTFVTPNPRTSHLFLNLELGTYGQTTLTKLNTGEVIAEVLAWTLKPFVDTSTTPPFQVGTIGPEVDPPIDEVKNITCAEAVRKMLRWSPDAVAWFDHTTSPPTFHCQRHAALDVYNLDIRSLKPTSINLRARFDLQRPFVRIQYERLNTSNEIEYPETIEDLYPDPAPTGALNQFAGVPFAVDLRGYRYTSLPASIKTAVVNTADVNWWLDNAPEFKAGLEDSTGGAGDSAITSFTINSGSIKTKLEGSETDLALPNQLIGGTPTDWIPASGGGTARWQRVTKICEATIVWRNGHKDSQRKISVQFTSTDAVTGDYSLTTTNEPADPVPVNLAQDLYESVARVPYEGSVSFRPAELGGLPQLGHKLNVLGSANSDWPTMATLVQRVRENIHGRTCSIDVGPPPHLELTDLVALFRVTRNRTSFNAYSHRTGGGASTTANRLRNQSARQNNSNAQGNAEKIVASGSIKPPTETDDAKKGLVTLDGPNKKLTVAGATADGTILLQVGTIPVVSVTKSADVAALNIDGVPQLVLTNSSCNALVKTGGTPEMSLIGAGSLGTAKIRLQDLTGTNKDVLLREVKYQDKDCNWKKRWVFCTAEESSTAP